MRSPVTSRSNCAKDKQDVQGQPAHGRRGVELLGHGYEGCLPGVEGLDDLGEVGQAAGEAIDFVNHDGVDLLGRDVFEQLFERGPVHVSTRVAAVVVASRNDSPALVALTQDESLAGFPLRIEGVEGLLQTFFTRLPGIYRTTNDRLYLTIHDTSFDDRDCFAFRPKNSGPDRRVPVMSRAISERLS